MKRHRQQRFVTSCAFALVALASVSWVGNEFKILTNAFFSSRLVLSQVGETAHATALLQSMSVERGIENETKSSPYAAIELEKTDCSLLPPSQRKGLEFLHIPKTGGSTIEGVALQQNISWSACHWLTRIPDIHGQPSCPPHAPRKKNMHQQYWVPYWHLPPHMIDDGSFTPYTGDKSQQLFAVVRNPYTRLLSEWNYHRNAVMVDLNNATALNTWAQDFLKRILNNLDKPVFVKSGHLLPQHWFFQSSSHPVIVLRQEQLNQDFDCLMQRYGYNLALPIQKTNTNKEGRLSVRDYSNETIRMIQKAYAQDFKLFGYAMDPLLSAS